MTAANLGSPYDEAFVEFACHGDVCVGVLSRPVSKGPSEQPNIGIVIVVGGPQYRVGSHRQFTLLARDLARLGIPTLRFDYRGMGDSEGEARTFETVHDDLAAAVRTLVLETGVTRVVLWGLCDGATSALIYGATDPIIAGIVAVNPWARTSEIQGSVHLKHYYVRRLFAADFWRKVLRGGLKPKVVAGDFASAFRAAAAGSSSSSTASYLRHMQVGWSMLRRPVLFILSGHDLTAREFEEWVTRDPERRELFHGPLTEVCRIAAADHTFSSRASRETTTERTLEWIRQLRPGC